MTLFTDEYFNSEILRAIQDLGFTTPTEIQKESIPFILTDHRDLIALAQTGTGKTAAFSLPILEMIDSEVKHIQLLVLCPTRELCLQLAKDVKSYSKYLPDIKTVAVYGGSSISEQIRELRSKPQIVVGTPGRVIDLINRGVLHFSEIQWLTLDEADEMLSMGFKDDLETILRETPEEKQTLLFSATMSKEVEKISKKYLNNPHKISVGHINEVRKTIKHEYYVVPRRQKEEALKRIIDFQPDLYGIVFCRTRRETQEVADFLMRFGYAADALHGDLSQAQRDLVMRKFRLKNIRILVATDVAARGLDVDSLTHVIHFSLPDDSEIFVHRSGRTGRAGNQGTSVALVSPADTRKLTQIKKQAKIELTEKPIPTREDIVKAQVGYALQSLFSESADSLNIDESILPDLSGFTKEDLLKRLLQSQIKEVVSYYDRKNDMEIADLRESSYDSERRGERRGRQREGRRGGRRERREDMIRFFFNLGKRDQVRKGDILDIINKSTKKSSRRPDIGEIEILDKFSFFEVEKDFKRDVIRNIGNQKFKGREMRVEIAN